MCLIYYLFLQYINTIQMAMQHFEIFHHPFKQSQGRIFKQYLQFYHRNTSLSARSKLLTGDTDAVQSNNLSDYTDEQNVFFSWLLTCVLIH